MKKIYIIHGASDEDSAWAFGGDNDRLFMAINDIVAERHIPLYIRGDGLGFTEEDGIKARIELIRGADAVMFASDDSKLRKNMVNRIEIEAAKELRKTILMDSGAMRRWVSEWEEPKDELAIALIRKNAGLRHKARSNWEQLFGGKENG